MTRRYTRFAAMAQVAELRTAQFEGKEHLVVPVVALVGDSVVFPLGAPGPELVPSAVLARSVRDWNGRPVVGDHPMSDGAPTTANDPEVYERTCFGRIANPRWEGGRLKVEAWLDPDRALSVGHDAVSVCERAKAGKMIEVSIGAYVEVEPRSGKTANGEEYVGVWSDVGSDHLAMLPEGTEGACSIEMGCGAPRAAKKRSVMNKQNSLMRFLARLGWRASQDDEGPSDSDVRGALWDALRAVEPGFDGVVEVYPDSSTVIYATWPEDEMYFWRRTYSAVEDGSISLSDDREQVEPTTKWETVAAKDGETESSQPGDPSTNLSAAQEPCGCNTKQLRAAHNDTAAKAEGEQMATIKDLVGRLIQCGKSPFTEEDRKMLEGSTEERLQALADGFAESEDVEEEAPKPVPEPEPKPEPEKTAEPMTEEQWLKAAPQSLRSMVEQHKAAEDAKRARLVSALSKAQSTYTEEQLKAKETADLEALGSILKLDEPKPDYSGMGVPTLTGAQSDESIFDPPDTYGLAKNKAADGKEAN